MRIVPEGSNKFCSFCFRGQRKAGCLAEGITNTAYICADCSKAIAGKFEEINAKSKIDSTPACVKNKPDYKKTARAIGKIPNPKFIEKILSEIVIGQDKAIKTLAVSICSHFCRL